MRISSESTITDSEILMQLDYIYLKINQMKKLILLSVFTLVLSSCQNTSDTNRPEGISKEELNINEKIAYAHGFENFEEIEEINFTFNVKVNDSLRSKRIWRWKPKEKEVRLTENNITLNYNQNNKELSDEERSIDRKFINDSYWLLFPFQLVWSNAEFEEEQEATAPISNEKMNKLTVTYPDEGGYTPGDTYEIFYNDDYKLKEWVYKAADGNRETATTWENYQDYQGLKIATSHKSPERNFELFFTNIEIKE